MIAIISCISKNGVIGKNGKLPWNYPSDLKRFKELTMNHTVVFGRKTFESINKELPKRKIIVLTRNKNYKNSKIIVKHSHQEILDKYLKNKEKCYICGGGEIYRLFIDNVVEIFLTVIEKEYQGDVFFPVDMLKRFKIKESYSLVENGTLLNFFHYILI